MKKAFTLIEILVAITIMAVITGIVIVQTNNSANAAKDAKRKADVDVITNALVQYRSEHYSTAPIETSSCEIGGEGEDACSDFDSEIQTFLQSLPKDPDGTSYIYNSNDDGSDCTVTATLSNGKSYTYDCETEAAAEANSAAGDCGITSATSLSSTSSGLCDAGTPVAFSGTGPWTWTCQGVSGGGDATCLAFVQLSCYVANGDCPNTILLNMSSSTGGHAELATGTNYNYQVCCTGPSLSSSCSATKKATILKLSATTNAHVEENTLSNYLTDSCLATSDTLNAICSYASSCSDIGPEYECLASISDTTNAHIGDCDAFATKVCCNVY
ncbi:MAG: prepilin-type N-terminal cleavage/methylation domain-containing protein [Candidatus Pacebacteria bacterium]|nr:prepilin-type N-terminal cleavage/methylation domain-containing protein [Candidatus Paceibacterota bacterium]